MRTNVGKGGHDANRALPTEEDVRLKVRQMEEAEKKG